MKFLKKITLFWQIIIALAIGITVGIVFKQEYKLNEKKFIKIERLGVNKEVVKKLSPIKDSVFTSEKEFLKNVNKYIGDDITVKQRKKIVNISKIGVVKYISWMGVLFLRALTMIIIPLILTSIIPGVTNIGTGKNLGRLGLKTMVYYTLTSVFAIVTGLFFVNLIKPGKGANLELAEVEGLSAAKESFGDTLMNIIPTNIFESLTNGHMLSIIFFAILFGFFITKTHEKSRIFLTDFFNSSFDVMMRLTQFIIKFTPLGIMGIIAKTVAEQDNLAGIAGRLGVYMLVVIIALFFHAAITLPLSVRIIGKANPFKHLKSMRNALMTAFSTSSSGATLSLTMDCVKNKSGVSNKIAGFTLPLGATVNMDGTALYELVAAMFIAQAYGLDMTIGQQIIAVVTALLASIGAAGIPMAGLVMITIVLSAMGLPLEGVGLIFAVDRILDMFRTTVNVWSDSCAAVIIAKSEGEKLKV